MYHGYVETICTTNFDRLFEDAYYKLYNDSPDITYIALENENKTNLPITKKHKLGVNPIKEETLIGTKNT